MVKEFDGGEMIVERLHRVQNQPAAGGWVIDAAPEAGCLAIGRVPRGSHRLRLQATDHGDGAGVTFTINNSSTSKSVEPWASSGRRQRPMMAAMGIPSLTRHSIRLPIPDCAGD